MNWVFVIIFSVLIDKVNALETQLEQQQKTIDFLLDDSDSEDYEDYEVQKSEFDKLITSTTSIIVWYCLFSLLK